MDLSYIVKILKINYGCWNSSNAFPAHLKKIVYFFSLLTYFISQSSLAEKWKGINTGNELLMNQWRARGASFSGSIAQIHTEDLAHQETRSPCHSRKSRLHS